MNDSTHSALSTHADRRIKVLVILTAVIAVMLSMWALKYTRVVTMPLVFAFFVAVLVRPIQVWLEKRLPDRFWWVALVMTMLVILLALASFAAVGWYAVQRISGEEIRGYAEQLRAQWEQVRHWLVEHDFPVGDSTGGGGEVSQRLMGRVGTATAWLLRSMTDLTSMLVLIFFFVLLMLLEASRWRSKVRTVANPHQREVADTMEAAAMQVRQFILVQTFVSLITAIAAWVWLWAIGVPFPLLWALLTFLLNFVPNIGSILSGAMATLVALLALGWWQGLLTAVGLVTIEQIMGNYVDPMLKAKRMGMSSVVVLFAVIFWTWVWGAAGAVLAVPIMATLIIIFARIPTLRPMALLLSTTDDEEELIRQTSGTKNPSPGE